MKKGGFRLILGGQKSSKMMICSKHDKHEKSMLYTANLRLEGVQKLITKSRKKQKNKKTQTTEKTPKMRGHGPHGDHWVTLVWARGSLGHDHDQRKTFNIRSKLVISQRLWAEGPANF